MTAAISRARKMTDTDILNIRTPFVSELGMTFFDNPDEYPHEPSKNGASE